jgi:Guanylate-binding protein, N-terminal domain/Guanylate-binding protein, C-terminal domain
MTQQEYLERALAEKGPQEDQKNQIRRALKRYFKDRQCCTMIRPLTNEDELQNLDKLPLEELRAEFVAQVHGLRRAVLGNIRPKSINGHIMNGAEWIQLVEVYVQAINDGAVPSIQSAWTYICKQSANKAYEDGRQHFE